MPPSKATQRATILLLIAALATSANGQELQEVRGRTMGTTYSLLFYHCGEHDAAALQSAIDTRLAEIDERMSTYRDDSELSRFNREAKANEWFEVSLETAEVTQLAIKLAAKTNGAFDPTVGPLVDLWRFGPQTGDASFQPPSDDEIKQTLEQVGYQKLTVRLDPPALRKSIDALRVDLSAIAKGHGVDSLLDVLIAHKASNAMVEIGGEVRTLGPRGESGPWRIAVEAPTPGTRKLHTVVPIADTAMATSGDYRNFYEHEGKRYSHTIDPRTGRPAEHKLGSATILADTCAEADALATAVLVLGPDEGLAWTNDNMVAAFLLDRGEDDAINALKSDTMPEVIPTAPNGAAPAAEEGGFLTVLLAAMIIFGVALFGMAIGVVISNRSIQGSCGGLAGMKDDDGNTLCVACNDPSPECTGESDGECDGENDAGCADEVVRAREAGRKDEVVG